MKAQQIRKFKNWMKLQRKNLFLKKMNRSRLTRQKVIIRILQPHQKKSTDKTEKETPTRTNAKSVQSSSTTIKQTRKETTTKKVTTTTKPTTTKKHTTTQKSFDVNHYVSYAKNYAKSIGLNLDSGCTDCWDNPINANANCSNIERDIKSRLNRYKNVEGFTDVWIWAESTGNGNYNIYIGYA